MAPMTGCNFLRAGAPRQFAEGYQRQNEAPAKQMSIMAYLSLLKHQQPPRHHHLSVSGLDHLWAACEDDDALRTRVKQRLLISLPNRLQNKSPGVYLKSKRVRILFCKRAPDPSPPYSTPASPLPL